MVYICLIVYPVINCCVLLLLLLLLLLGLFYFLSSFSCGSVIIDDFDKSFDIIYVTPIHILFEFHLNCNSRPGTVVVADSKKNKWIFIVKSVSFLNYYYSRLLVDYQKDTSLEF